MTPAITSPTGSFCSYPLIPITLEFIAQERLLSQTLLPPQKKKRAHSKVNCYIAYLYCIVIIYLKIGARQGEILNLEWRDIDFAYLKETKNGRPRSISLAAPVIVELKPLVFDR